MTLRAIALGVAASLAIAASVQAAMDGTLSTDHAFVGASVTFKTDNHGRTGTYVGLETGRPIPLFLLPPTSKTGTCDAIGGVPIGPLSWDGGVGSLTFVVPDVQPAQYVVAATVEGQCWRTGSASGATLTLTVERGSQPDTSSIAPTIALVAAFVLGALMLAVHSRRRPHDT